MKNRNNVNIIIDLFLFIVLAVLAGIGWLIKFILPPGRDRILKTGENRDLFFLGLDRHAWGTIHLIAALVMLGLLVLHIVFHWKMILCMLRNAFPARGPRRILVASTVIISAVFFLGAFLIVPRASDSDMALYRHVRRNSDPAGLIVTPPEVPPPGAPAAPAPGGETEKEPAYEAERPSAGLREEPPVDDRHEGAHSESGNAILNGQMTLSEAAAACGITMEDLRRKLGLPEGYPGTETLGRLRRARGLTMIQIRDLLEKSSPRP